MLIGEYIHTIDSKKRLAVPAKLRKTIGESAVLTKGLNNCLALYPAQQWEKQTERMANLSTGQAEARGFQRMQFAGAVVVELDQLGRILIPDFLKEYAGLKQKATLVGVHNRLEIWDTERWEAYKTEMEKNTDMIAEKLGEQGLY